MGKKTREKPPKDPTPQGEGPSNLLVLDALPRGSRIRRDATTIKALVVTRGRDRGWERNEDVLYLEQHARVAEARKTFPRPTAELVLTYEDAARLVEVLQREIAWARRDLPKTSIRSPRCTSRQRDNPDTPEYRCQLPAGHDGDHCDTRDPLHPSWKRA